jgi:hypothetical protein
MAQDDQMHPSALFFHDQKWNYGHLELEDAWRVEYFDSDGAGYIAIFLLASRRRCERATTTMP